jgi:hypothetical protein
MVYLCNLCASLLSREDIRNEPEFLAKWLANWMLASPRCLRAVPRRWTSARVRKQISPGGRVAEARHTQKDKWAKQHFPTPEAPTAMELLLCTVRFWDGAKWRRAAQRSSHWTRDAVQSASCREYAGDSRCGYGPNLGALWDATQVPPSANAPPVRRWLPLWRRLWYNRPRQENI